MIDAVRLYWALRSRGIWITAANGRLWFDAPKGQVTPAVRESVRQVQIDLLRLFSEPCPCASCAEAADDGPVLRLYCPSGLDADATWQALRREFDALDAEDERVCIQAEACGESSLSPGTACDAEGRGIRGVQRNADPEVKHD